MTAAALHLPRPSPAHSAPALVGSSGLAALRTQLHAVVAGQRAAGKPWATGITSLDTALGGGIPRGRITEVVGALGVGKTALLRAVVTRVLQSGGWVAWIDARRTLAAAPWAGLGERLVMIRPRDNTRSAWCADMLLRSGVFALVVIDGAPLLSRVHGVRLAQLARERDAACVVLHDDTRPSRVSGAVRLRLLAGVSQTVSVIVEKGGLTHHAYPIKGNNDIVMAHRLCTDSTIPDRRGVARSTRRPWAAVGGSVDPAIGHPVTWGGLAVSANHAINSNDASTSNHTAGQTSTDRDTARPRLRGAEHVRAPHERVAERERFDREFDKRTRDWTSYRGRRRAAESSFGSSTRKRERARERVGTSVGAHGGQGGERGGARRRGRDTQHDSTRGTSRDTAHNPQYATPYAASSTRPALGRVAEGVGR